MLYDCMQVCWVTSAVSDYLWTYGPTRLLHPWDSPGKNTGVGCHFLLQGIFPMQECNPRLLPLLHLQVDSLPVAPPGQPNAMLLMSYKKGNFGQRDRHVHLLQAKECLSLPGARGDAWNKISLTTSQPVEGPSPSWSHTSKSSDCETLNFHCLSHPVFAALLLQP